MSATSTPTGRDRIMQWLATADPDPEHAHRWWSAQRLAVLPLGRAWDAVKVPTARGERAIAAGIAGPVIADPAGGCLYFLVPPGTADVWTPVRGVEALGGACYLTVPSPDRTSGSGVHWRTLPDGSGTLVQTGPLRDALAPRPAPETDLP